MDLPEPPKAPSYIFPNFLAKIMAKVDMRTQYEAGMMSMSLILCGIVISGIYVLLYVNVPLWYKIVLVINALAAFVFISSFVITTYQQYLSYMETANFQKEVKEMSEKFEGGKT